MQMKIPFRFLAALNALSMWAFLAMFSLNAANAADIAHLTGVKLFSTNDLNGNFNSSHWYDTVGGNTGWNVYLVDATGGKNGSFINTGNGASTSIDIPLNLGTYSFWMFNGSESANYWGLNLFFDSDQINPKITAITTKKTGAPDPPFMINPALQVPILADNSTAASANSLVYQANGALITLTTYFFADASVFQMDRVSSFNSIPGGSNNSVSFMTLTVSNVPEPSTYALGAITTCLLGYIARRRNNKTTRLTSTALASSQIKSAPVSTGAFLRFQFNHQGWLDLIRSSETIKSSPTISSLFQRPSGFGR